MYFYYAQSSLFVFLCSHPVRRASANVVSIIAKYAIPAGEWPELLPFLFQCSQSPQEDHREVSQFGEVFLPSRCIYTVFTLKNNKLYVTISLYQINFKFTCRKILFATSFSFIYSRFLNFTTLCFGILISYQRHDGQPFHNFLLCTLVSLEGIKDKSQEIGRWYVQCILFFFASA